MGQSRHMANSPIRASNHLSKPGVLRGGVVSAHVSEQQLAVWTRVITLLAWKRLTSMMTASMKVQTLLLDTAVVTELTPVGFLLTVSPDVSEQRAAIYRSIRTLSTPVRLLTCVCPQVLQQRGLQAAAVGAVRTGVRFVSSVDSQVASQRQFGGELPVAQRATEVCVCGVLLFFCASSRSLPLFVLCDVLQRVRLTSAALTVCMLRCLLSCSSNQPAPPQV